MTVSRYILIVSLPRKETRRETKLKVQLENLSTGGDAAGMPSPAGGQALGVSSTGPTVNARVAVAEAGRLAEAAVAAGRNAGISERQSCFCWRISRCTATSSCRR